MNIKFNYLENKIIISNEYVRVMEIASKEYFYRIIKEFNCIKNGNISDEVYIFNDELKEINLTNKMNLVIDYFNIDFNKKTNIIKLNKLIEENLSELSKIELSNLYKKIYKLFSLSLENVELPITINDSYSINDFIKILEFNLETNNNILDNLFLLIDITKTLNLDKLIVFVNIKQYLSDDDLVEFYKYVIYHNCHILLIENICHTELLEYEKKLIIDCDLVEYIV